MSRNNTAHVLSELPWWLAVVLSVLIYVCGKYIIPQVEFKNPIFIAFGGAAQALSTPISLAFLSIGVLSLIGGVFTRKRRNALFDKQTSIESVRALSWLDFERLIGEYFNRQGYSVAENTKQGADGGVDLRLVKNGESVIVQCKHWKNKIGVPVVREHLGAVTAQKASRGIVVTSGKFTRTARTFAVENNVGLIDGSDLAELFEKGILPDASGVENAVVPQIQSLPECPVCNAVMVERTARKGSNAGRAFYGCSEFPRCRATRPI